MRGWFFIGSGSDMLTGQSLPRRSEANGCPLTPPVASLIFYHASLPYRAKVVGGGRGKSHHSHFCKSLWVWAGPFWGKIIIHIPRRSHWTGRMHLAQTSSEEGTVPTWLFTKGLDGDLSVCSYASKIEKLYVFSFLFVHGLNFGSTHACDFLCNTCGLEVKERGFWKRPQSSGGSRDILQFIVVLVFIPLSLVFVCLFLQKAWGRILVRNAYKQRSFTNKVSPFFPSE